MIMVKTLLLQTETSYIWQHNGSIKPIYQHTPASFLSVKVY